MLSLRVDMFKDRLVAVGFEVVCIDYVAKETVNHKEDVKLDRSFLQCKCRRPESSASAHSELVPAAALTKT